MAGSKSLGTLTLDLVARTGGWVKGMDKAERSSKKWRRQVERDLKKVGGQFAKFAKVAAGAGIAAGGAFALMAKQGLDFVDSQAKTAARLGSTIDDLRAIQIAASDFGIEQEQLTRSLSSFTKRLGDAARGTGEAQKAYEALGLEASELVNLPLPEQLALIAERIAEVDSAAERTSISDRLMSGGRRMVNLFEEGGGAIHAAVQEVDDFGLSLSAVDAAKVEQANDALGRIPRLLEPIKSRIAINLADPLTDATGLILEAAQETDGFKAAIDNAMATAFEGASKFLTQIDRVILALQKVQEFQLKAEAFGGTLNRILDPTRSTDDMPEAFTELQALQQDMARRRARIENGSAVTNFLDDAGAGIRGEAPQLDQTAVNMARLIGSSSAELAGKLSAASDAANDSAEADEDKTEKTKSAADAVKGLGDAATRSAQALAQAASAGGDPRFNIAAGGDSIEERARARFEASAFRPGDASVINYGGPAGMSASRSLSQTASQVSSSAGGGAKDRGSVHITVTGKDGNSNSGDVEGEDEFIRQLASALSGAASAS